MKVDLRFRKRGDDFTHVQEMAGAPRVGDIIFVKPLELAEPYGRVVEKVTWLVPRPGEPDVRIELS